MISSNERSKDFKALRAGERGEILDRYLETKGRIFDIQRYSIHDGYGIRTIVFLKGCVLRCRWCCNPESQEYKIQTMMVQGQPKVMGQDVTVGEVLEIVEKDRNYYRRTGGGLTLSGGESLCQPEFTRDILKAAKEAGISTALESTACVKYDVIEEILPYLDQYLLDIKHMDAKKHQEYTGQSNALILENARKIAESNLTELSIRVPVVPGFNDTEKEIEAIAAFVKKLRNVRRLHLLPYHRLGQDKYEGLEREYLLKNILPPEEVNMQRFLKIALEVSGVECQIGG
jgi:glycyl-radical enzyme activating protein family